MGNINVMRVLLGGLLAGVVINIGEYVAGEFIFAEQSAAFMERLGLAEFGAGQIVTFVIIGFLYGIALIWLYAAIRPRFGAGVKTAIIAAVTMWFVAWLLVAVSYVAMGLLSAGVMIGGIIWGLIEVAIAAVAGAWLYQESAAG